MHRAYSLFEVKSLDAKRRSFSGLATTPALDRVSDSIDPLSAQFKNPLVLLHQHDHKSPIGTVTFKKPTKAGIPFEAEIPVINEPGPLKDRTDTAWGEIEHGLVRAVSIGFRPDMERTKPNKAGGYDFEGIEIFELSTVSVPANAQALIHTIKSLDDAAMAEAGVEPPAEDPEIPAAPEPAATGKKARVVKLDDAARVRAQPFVVQKIKRTA